MQGILVLAWFLVSISVMLVLAKKNLWLAIFVAGLILAFSTSNSINVIFNALIKMSSIDNILLAFALMEIPLIGKLLENPLTENISFLDRRVASVMGPAIFGFLAVPGGAVLSCPLVDRIIGNDLPVNKKAALNVWFRHITFFVYPLSTALIVAVALSGLDLVVAIAYMFPMLIVSVIIGYMFYLRGLSGGKNAGGKLYPGAITIIILAPVVQIVANILKLSMELSAFIGVTVAFLLSIFYVKITFRKVLALAKRIEAWEFGLVYLAIMFYGYVFAQTSVSNVIYSLSPPRLLLTVIIPFLMGVATGRVQLALTILIPLYKGLFGVIDYFILTAMYTASSAGYLMSPVHPCLVLTSKYFRLNLHNAIKEIALPSILLTFFAAIYAGF
ncbi:MAG: DUF401 family protein [Crenarchaeota archaeon]|nr:DUF401 family protein [Thermoproteota archaeon]MCR8501596.1 DUF401 family protein [Thermoproteota archaeon]